MGLRNFRPDWLHVWQPKRFWHEFPQVLPLTHADVDHHTYFDTELTPATEVAEYPPGEVAGLVEEMRFHRDRFLESWTQKGSDGKRTNELRSFWIRKTKQPVLSVLMTRRGGESPVYYRGINMEVSMPTGSLCAERNAIGQALASNSALAREDMRMVAVLAIPRDIPDLTKQQAEGMDLSFNLGSAAEPVRERAGSGMGVLPRASPTLSAIDPNGELIAPPQRVGSPRHGNPVGGAPKDNNPLDPCGACSEWLRKIAEINPDFQVDFHESVSDVHIW